MKSVRRPVKHAESESVTEISGVGESESVETGYLGTGQVVDPLENYQQGRTACGCFIKIYLEKNLLITNFILWGKLQLQYDEATGHTQY